MFEEREVRNAHFKFNGHVYGAPELEAYEGEAVQVSASALFPASVLVMTKRYEYICLAKNSEMWQQIIEMNNRQQVLGAIETMIVREEIEDGPSAMRPYPVDEWIVKIRGELKESAKHAAYGNEHHALDSLLKAAKQCVQCLEYHLERKANEGKDQLEEAINQLDNNTTDPEATESAA